MSYFDAEIFASAIMVDVTNEKLSEETRLKIHDMRTDIEATLAALEVERDSRRARALRDDLLNFLKGRTEDILESVKKDGLPSAEIRVFTEALVFASRAATVVSRAFVCGGGL